MSLPRAACLMYALKFHHPECSPGSCYFGFSVWGHKCMTRPLYYPCHSFTVFWQPYFCSGFSPLLLRNLRGYGASLSCHWFLECAGDICKWPETFLPTVLLLTTRCELWKSRTIFSIISFQKLHSWLGLPFIFVPRTLWSGNGWTHLAGLDCRRPAPKSLRCEGRALPGMFFSINIPTLGLLLSPARPCPPSVWSFLPWLWLLRAWAQSSNARLTLAKRPTWSFFL